MTRICKKLPHCNYLMWDSNIIATVLVHDVLLLLAINKCLDDLVLVMTWCVRLRDGTAAYCEMLWNLAQTFPLSSISAVTWLFHIDISFEETSSKMLTPAINQTNNPRHCPTIWRNIKINQVCAIEKLLVLLVHLEPLSFSFCYQQKSE